MTGCGGAVMKASKADVRTITVAITTAPVSLT